MPICTTSLYYFDRVTDTENYFCYEYNRLVFALSVSLIIDSVERF